MATNTLPESNIPIACNPDAIPSALREEWIAAGKAIYAAVQEIVELADGYRFRLPTDSSMLVKTAQYMSNERLCCAFLRFTLEVTPGAGPMWLSLTGGEGVKDYIRSVFATSDLLSEAVVKMAHFSGLER